MSTVISTRAAHRGRRRTLLGIGLGNAMEWFDFAAYAVFAPFFAKQIFDPSDPSAALLATLAVFGAGFVIRPFGAVFFGWLADRKGRRASLILAVLCASLGMVLIAVVPTYETVGLLSGAILLLARLLQGVAHTGEVAAAYAYVAEVAPAHRRGLWASSIYVSGLGAILVATILGALLTTLLGPAEMAAYGWRLPFVLGAVLGLLTLVLRRTMDETEAFTRQVRDADATPAAAKSSLLRGLWVNRAAGIRVFVLTAANAVFFYAWAVSGPSWAISVAGLGATTALWAGVVALAVGIVALPILGALSDRIGRRPSFYIFGVGAAVLAFPLDRLARGGEAWQFALAMTLALVLFAFIGAIFPALLAELFPTGMRASGIALPYSVAAVVFAGTAPYLQQWLNQHGSGDAFIAYTAVVALLGAVVMYFTRETRGIALDSTMGDDSAGTTRQGTTPQGTTPRRLTTCYQRHRPGDPDAVDPLGDGAAGDSEPLGEARLGPARLVALDDQQTRVNSQAGIAVRHRGPPVVGMSASDTPTPPRSPSLD